jgi:hypothetical protein
MPDCLAVPCADRARAGRRGDEPHVSDAQHAPGQFDGLRQAAFVAPDRAPSGSGALQQAERYRCSLVTSISRQKVFRDSDHHRVVARSPRQQLAAEGLAFPRNSVAATAVMADCATIVGVAFASDAAVIRQIAGAVEVVLLGAAGDGRMRAMSRCSSPQAPGGGKSGDGPSPASKCSRLTLLY